MSWRKVVCHSDFCRKGVAWNGVSHKDVGCNSYKNGLNDISPKQVYCNIYKRENRFNKSSYRAIASIRKVSLEIKLVIIILVEDNYNKFGEELVHQPLKCSNIRTSDQ